MTEFHEIEHVQLAMRPGGEDLARAFYGQVLGFREIAKPDALRASAVAWFAAARIEIHLRAEDPMHPSHAAHPGIRVTGLADLAARCEAAGHPPQFDVRYPGRRRFYVADPFGNRLEFFETTGAHIERTANRL
jgi:catechol 2,3-dioxygenase-like lactoylglutathione lyase family enzyme